MGPSNQRSQVEKFSTRVGVLNDRAEHRRVEGHPIDGHDAEIDSQWFGSRTQDIDRLRKATIARVADSRFDPLLLAGVRAVHQRHCFGGGRCLIQQRGTRHFHPGQIGHHRLEVEKRFQAALCDLRLIGRVWRVPPRVLHHHPKNHARRERVVVAKADVGLEDAVAMGEMTETMEVLMLAFSRWKCEWFLETDRGGNRLVHQRIERWCADCLEHFDALVRRRSDVAACKPVAGVEGAHYALVMPSYCVLSSSDPASLGSDTRTFTIQVS